MFSDPQTEKYTSLIATLDAPIESFRKPVIRDIKKCYRNPHRFRSTERDIAHIDPSEAVDLTRGL